MMDKVELDEVIRRLEVCLSTAGLAEMRLLVDCARELKAWREGGVTEEILRRHDGYIKVGRGCVIALEREVREKIEPKDPGFQGYQQDIVSPVTENPKEDAFYEKIEADIRAETLPLRWRRRLLQNKEGNYGTGSPLLEYWTGKTWEAVPETA